MSSQTVAKREQTMRTQLLKLLSDNQSTGLPTYLIPKHLRRFLRQLELEGKIFYAVHGWFVKS